MGDMSAPALNFLEDAMCCGMGCPYENTNGECRRDQRISCFIEESEHQKETGTMSAAETDQHCPDCESTGRRTYLHRDAGNFCCPHCGMAYTPEQLRKAYQAEYDDLIANAAWTRTQIDSLRAAAA